MVVGILFVLHMQESRTQHPLAYLLKSFSGHIFLPKWGAGAAVLSDGRLRLHRQSPWESEPETEPYSTRQKLMARPRHGTPTGVLPTIHDDPFRFKLPAGFFRVDRVDQPFIKNPKRRSVIK